MNKFEYFKHPSGKIHTAINLGDGYFIAVFMSKTNAEILLRNGENATQLRYNTCIERDIESTEMEFTKAIGEANSIIQNTPFL